MFNQFSPKVHFVPFLAPDDSLNAIPLDGEVGELAGLTGKSNDADLTGILASGNDFGGDSTADSDFPIQDNQEASGLVLPDLNSNYP